ncbi:glycosyltransferase family 4 protein [archaeon]|jgi:glycosyltransferase involved in cell wall biosynthesis|nr:glycosyltransferase family 4 protein [archaeon]MBT4022050.1 glycosyltransferase family 4 protein [archaeon]MBT4272663.1 glycosyltransferase family 4 protein [archaeon]MBT4461461.1 glycosyltransferase family 4 protein [archaeon]MBT4857769.1 glycosyltransferase family 4 protein [archaeon]
MKIAIVYDMIYPYSIGGAEYRNFSLAKELVLKGHEVHLFGQKMWSGDKTKRITNGFFIHGLTHAKKKYNFKGQRKIFDPIIYSFVLFFELMKHNFDIIDCSAFPYFPSISCKLYSVLKKKPFIITWHEVWYDYWSKYRKNIAIFGKLTEKFVSKLSKNNIAVSIHTKKRLNKLTSKKIKLIENWIETSEIKKAKPYEKKYDIISVGRHLIHKNFHLLLKIASVLNLKVLIIGQGPETPHLLKIRKELDLKNVDILSFSKEKNQLYRYLKSAKIFVLLSELEGFSIVAFEAMAAGLPIITLNSKRNALKEYIKDNGFVCNKNQIEISDKINMILKNKALQKKMSKKSLEIAKKFDSKIKTKQIIKYYNEIKHNYS